jgi:hypothetical protein
MIPNARPKISIVTPIPPPTSWVVVNFSLLHLRKSLSVSHGEERAEITYVTESLYSQTVEVDVSGDVVVALASSVESDMISIVRAGYKSA